MKKGTFRGGEDVFVRVELSNCFFLHQKFLFPTDPLLIKVELWWEWEKLKQRNEEILSASAGASGKHFSG